MRVRSLESARVVRRSEPVYGNNDSHWIYRAWVRSCVLGTVLALTASAMVSVTVSIYLTQYRPEVYSVVAIALVAITAALEGAVIGYFQWRLLRRVFPTMSGGTWIGATMIAAGSGCLLSWLPTSFALTSALASRVGDVTVGTAAVVRISLVTGALIGLVWGVAQHAVLRLHVHQAASWILASTVVWTISFGPLYFAAFVPDRTTSPLIHILLAAGGGLVLGSVMGLVHGRVLVTLRSRLLVPLLSR